MQTTLAAGSSNLLQHNRQTSSAQTKLKTNHAAVASENKRTLNKVFMFGSNINN